MKPVVTDHALVRWLERHHGFDLEPFRAELAALTEPYVAIKARAGAVTPQLWVILDGVKVVTVSPEKGRTHLGDVYDSHVPERMNWKARARKRAHK